MKLTFEVADRRFTADLSTRRSIAIDLDFEGSQPSHFGAEPATREPMRTGDFTGRTELGAGCNVDWLRINPHCNGTHTETVGHIVGKPVWVGTAALRSMFPAALVTVGPESADGCNESYRPELQIEDRLVTRASLESVAVQQHSTVADALIVRTSPNPDSKKTMVFGKENAPAFLSIEAIRYIVDLGYKHLLVDIPSVDRMHDEGLLTNHHVFWNVPEQTHDLTNEASTERTITEMIFVPDDIADGLYLLNLQIPAFCCDAAPSRPVLFSIDEIQND